MLARLITPPSIVHCATTTYRNKANVLCAVVPLVCFVGFCCVELSYFVVLYCIVLCHIVLYYIVSCCVVLYCLHFELSPWCLVTRTQGLQTGIHKSQRKLLYLLDWTWHLDRNPSTRIITPLSHSSYSLVFCLSWYKINDSCILKSSNPSSLSIPLSGMPVVVSASPDR